MVCVINLFTVLNNKIARIIDLAPSMTGGDSASPSQYFPSRVGMSRRCLSRNKSYKGNHNHNYMFQRSLISCSRWGFEQWLKKTLHHFSQGRKILFKLFMKSSNPLTDFVGIFNLNSGWIQLNISVQMQVFAKCKDDLQTLQNKIC